MEGPRSVVNERCVAATVCFFLSRMNRVMLTFDSQYGRLQLEVEDVEFLTGRNSK